VLWQAVELGELAELQTLTPEAVQAARERATAAALHLRAAPATGEMVKVWEACNR